MLILILLVSFFLMVTITAVRVLRRHWAAVGGVGERIPWGERFKAYWFPFLMLAAIVSATRDAWTGTGWFRKVGFFDLAAQWKYGVIAAVVLGFLVWTEGGRWLESRRRTRLGEEIRAVAEDLWLPPDDVQLEDIVALYELQLLIALRDQLRELPVGQRTLQRALDIVDPIVEPAEPAPTHEPIADSRPVVATPTPKIPPWSPEQALPTEVADGLRTRAWYRRGFAIGLLLLAGAIVAQSTTVVPLQVSSGAWLVAVLGGWLAFVCGLHVCFAPCPRCRATFASLGESLPKNPLVSACVHCGVPISHAAGNR